MEGGGKRGKGWGGINPVHLEHDGCLKGKHFWYAPSVGSGAGSGEKKDWWRFRVRGWQRKGSGGRIEVEREKDLCS